MKTVLVQSFRTSDVPGWIARCMASAQNWARLRGYDYEFVDDRIVSFCGPAFLSRVGNNMRSITNLARLELVRERLNGDYERAIWLDADVFVFAPEEFTIDVTSGYAFGKEVWLWHDSGGHLSIRFGVHNAALVFTRNQPDLDFLIATIRHIVATRHIEESYRIGVQLLSGLSYPLGFGLLASAGMFSGSVILAIASDDQFVLKALARAQAAPIHAANLCLSLSDQTSAGALNMAMNRLEETAGDIVNRHLPPGSAGADLPLDMWRLSQSATDMLTGPGIWPSAEQLRSPAWLLKRGARQSLLSLLPQDLRSRLHRIYSRVRHKPE